MFYLGARKRKNDGKKTQQVEIKDWEHWGLQTWSDWCYCSFQHCNGLSLLTPEGEALLSRQSTYPFLCPNVTWATYFSTGLKITCLMLH